MTGFAFAQQQATNSSSSNPVLAPTCSKKTPAEKCCSLADNASHQKHLHDVLTKEERHRFCCAKEAALAENPSLVGQKNIACKRALCQAIVKKDPTMQPIIDKLKNHWRETHKNGQASCDQPLSAQPVVAK